MLGYHAPKAELVSTSYQSTEYQSADIKLRALTEAYINISNQCFSSL